MLVLLLKRGGKHLCKFDFASGHTILSAAVSRNPVLCQRYMRYRVIKKQGILKCGFLKKS